MIRYLIKMVNIVLRSPFSLFSTAFKTFSTWGLTPTCEAGLDLARLDFQFFHQYLAKLLIFLHQLLNEHLVFQYLNA